MKQAALLVGVLSMAACAASVPPTAADLVLVNGGVYTFSWGEPGLDGTPAADAPYDGSWQPDAQAIAIERGIILFVGSDDGAERYIGRDTRVVDLRGATALPGLVDAHTHVLSLGMALPRLERANVPTAGPIPAPVDVPTADPIPEPTADELRRRYLLGFEAMVASGFTMVHEAGVDGRSMDVLEGLAADGRLPLRVYAMISARDEQLMRRWIEWGPDTDGNDYLITRSVKAYRGFDEALVAAGMAAGFQANVHAIGDAGNRETLDFFDRTLSRYPQARALRNRIEHAQIVAPADFWRFRTLGLTASMQPPHAVEDKVWAIERLGAERLAGAYAWRSFRAVRVPLVFSSDLPGSDHDIFYGLQAAMTRRDKDLLPVGGWYPEQAMTPEEAIRGYTTWAAQAALLEETSGTLAAGKWADITVMDIDPLVVGSTDPDRLFDGRIRMTIVGGRIVYESG